MLSTAGIVVCLVMATAPFCMGEPNNSGGMHADAQSAAAHFTLANLTSPTSIVITVVCAIVAVILLRVFTQSKPKQDTNNNPATPSPLSKRRQLDDTVVCLRGDLIVSLEKEKNSKEIKGVSATVTLTHASISCESVSDNGSVTSFGKVLVEDIVGVEPVYMDDNNHNSSNNDATSSKIKALRVHTYYKPTKTSKDRKYALLSLSLSEAQLGEQKGQETLRMWHLRIAQLYRGLPLDDQMPSNRNYLVFVNPVSGRAIASRVYRDIVEPMLQHSGIVFKTITTQYQNHAYDIIRRADISSLHGIICVSGDGTPFEVFNALMHREDNAKATQIPVAAIPAGSGNAIARTLSYFSGASLSMTSSIYDAVLVACQGHTFRMDGFRVTQKSLPELVQRFRSRRSDSAANSKLGNGNGNGELEKKSENGNGNGKEVNENEKSLFGVVSLQWGLACDCDIDSEWLRCLGSLRFNIYIAKNILFNNWVDGTISLLCDKTTTDWLNKHNESGTVAAAEYPKCDPVTCTICRGKKDAEGKEEKKAQDQSGGHLKQGTGHYVKCNGLRIDAEKKEKNRFALDGETMWVEPVEIVVQPDMVTVFCS